MAHVFDIPITWIIPVYNGEKHIRESINSILSQPCKNLEILVVDDGSADSTASIVKSIHDNRLHYIYQSNGGVSSARNFGIRSTDSDYITFLDADDVLCKNAYTHDVYNILKNGTYNLISFPYLYANQNLSKGNSAYSIEHNSEEFGPEIDCFKHASSFIYKRNYFEGNNAVYFYEGIRIQEDATFIFRITHQKCIVKNCARYWFAYRNNSSSVLHKLKDFDAVIHDAVKAWYLCRNDCIDKDTLDECDARLFDAATRYIVMSCQIGQPIKKIIYELEHAPIKDTLDNYQALWNSSKEIYESFYANPRLFWIKERIKGIKMDIRRVASNIPAVRNYYHKIKYKTDIRQYIPY